MKADGLGMRPSIMAASHLQGHVPSLPSCGCRPPGVDAPLLLAAELLTSACGTPSGGRHCSRTSCSSGTSLPSGSWSKFFRRSGRKRKTRGLPARCRNRETCKPLVRGEHRLGTRSPRVGKSLWHSTAGAKHVPGRRGQRNNPGWIQDSTWCSSTMPFLLRAFALLSFLFGAKPQLNQFLQLYYFFPPSGVCSRTLLHWREKKQGFHNSSAPTSVPKRIPEFQGYEGLFLTSAPVGPGWAMFSDLLETQPPHSSTKTGNSHC